MKNFEQKFKNISFRLQTSMFLFYFSFSDEFRSKVACENEVIQLVCNPFSRIAIYSASYGRTEYESIQCTQPQGVKEESKYLHVYMRLGYIVKVTKGLSNHQTMDLLI